VETDTFRALVGDNIVEILGESRIGLAFEFVILTTGEYCLIGAFRLTRTAINAFFRNLKGHFSDSSNNIDGPGCC
jgi:hypothetical protein